MLAQHAKDLILGKSASPHYSSPSDELTYQWHDFWGARHWVRVITQRMGTCCEWVMGHSKGGLAALHAAQRSDGIRGLILVAAPGRPMSDILKVQLRANPANAALSPDADRAIDTLAAGGRVDPATLPAPLRPLFPSVIQGFMILRA